MWKINICIYFSWIILNVVLIECKLEENIFLPNKIITNNSSFNSASRIIEINLFNLSKLSKLSKLIDVEKNPHINVNKFSSPKTNSKRSLSNSNSLITFEWHSNQTNHYSKLILPTRPILTYKLPAINQIYNLKQIKSSTNLSALISYKWWLKFFPSKYRDPALTLNEFAFRLIGVIICILVIIITIIGNVLTVFVVIKFPRMKSVTYILLASLAIADITVAVMVMPLTIVYDYLRVWPFGTMPCHFWISCDVMCCTSSILHLCAVAIDRYWTIINPFYYNMNKQRLSIEIFLIWIVSSAISFIPIFSGVYYDGELKTNILSFEEFPECSLKVNRIYAIFSSSISFIIPLLVMFFVYFRLFNIAEKQRKDIQKMQQSLHNINKRALTSKQNKPIVDRKIDKHKATCNVELSKKKEKLNQTQSIAYCLDVLDQCECKIYSEICNLNLQTQHKPKQAFNTYDCENNKFDLNTSIEFKCKKASKLNKKQNKFIKNETLINQPISNPLKWKDNFTEDIENSLIIKNKYQNCENCAQNLEQSNLDLNIHLESSKSINNLNKNKLINSSKILNSSICSLNSLNSLNSISIKSDQDVNNCFENQIHVQFLNQMQNVQQAKFSNISDHNKEQFLKLKKKKIFYQFVQKLQARNANNRSSKMNENSPSSLPNLANHLINENKIQFSLNSKTHFQMQDKCKHLIKQNLHKNHKLESEKTAKFATRNSSNNHAKSPRCDNCEFKTKLSIQSKKLNSKLNDISTLNQNLEKNTLNHKQHCKPTATFNDCVLNDIKRAESELQTCSKKILSESKAIRTLGIIMGVFVVCWLPFFIMYIMNALFDKIEFSHELRSAITWLGYLNSIFNPCIYAISNKEFNKYFRQILRIKPRFSYQAPCSNKKKIKKKNKLKKAHFLLGKRLLSKLTYLKEKNNLSKDKPIKHELNNSKNSSTYEIEAECEYES